MIYKDVTFTIGGTPLVELARMAAGQHGRLLAKLEMRNPCGSVKDRVGLAMIDDAEKKGKLLKAASDKHASAEEACKLIKNYGVAESKMIAYVEGHSTKCGIPPQVADQLKKGHGNTEMMTQKVCGAAQQAQARPAGPSLSDMLGTSTALPEATPTKKGGSTFDTLNGNVLTR